MVIVGAGHVGGRAAQALRELVAWGERGHDLPGVLTLRTLDDAAALAEKLSHPGAHLLIVGGGFIGLEVAASARARDVRVTVVEGAPRLLGRAVPASVARQVGRSAL